MRKSNCGFLFSQSLCADQIDKQESAFATPDTAQCRIVGGAFVFSEVSPGA